MWLNLIGLRSKQQKALKVAELVEFGSTNSYESGYPENADRERRADELMEGFMELSTVITALVLVLLIPAMVLSAILAGLGAVNKAARNSTQHIDNKHLPPETIRAAKQLVERFKRAGKQDSNHS